MYEYVQQQTNNEKNPVIGMVIIQLFHVRSISELYFSFTVKVVERENQIF